MKSTASILTFSNLWIYKKKIGWHTLTLILASIPKEIPNNSRPQSKDICYTHCLSEYTCAGNFSSSLHMLYVIFVHSHLYFKNPHLVTHFFCLEHSFVHIFVSTSHKASGSLSAQKRKQQQENKWDCYINWTLEHFRSSGCLPPCAGHAEQYSGSTLQARRRLGFLIVAWVSERGSAGSSYSAWVVDVLETVATSWEIYILADIINSPRAIFFPSPHLSVCTWHTHTCWIYCACAKNTI